MVVAPCPLECHDFGCPALPLSSLASYRPEKQRYLRNSRGIWWLRVREERFFFLHFLHSNLPDDLVSAKSLILAKFGQKITLKSLPIELLEAAETLILYELYIVRFSKC